MKTTISILLSFCLLLPFTGCSNVETSAAQAYKAAGVAEVTGKITFDGQPLADAQIQFSDNESLGSSFCYGVTDASGNYRMNVDSRRTGSLPGSKVVRIWTTLRGSGISELMQGEYRDKEIIPVEYNRGSTQKITVEPNKRQTFDFDLKSGGKVDPKGAPAFGESDSDGA